MWRGCHVLVDDRGDPEAMHGDKWAKERPGLCRDDHDH